VPAQKDRLGPEVSRPAPGFQIERRRIRDGERNVENARQRLRQQPKQPTGNSRARAVFFARSDDEV
jgi:hypothetical protein